MAGVCKLLHWSNYEKTKNVAVLPSEKNVNHFKIHPITILYIGLGKAFNKVDKICELYGEILSENENFSCGNLGSDYLNLC